mgnify:CR=1 FL=1
MRKIFSLTGLLPVIPTTFSSPACQGTSHLARNSSGRPVFFLPRVFPFRNSSASSQEEETLGGAMTSAFQLQPSFAIVIDVTHASSPGAPSHKTYPLGKGPAIGWGPNIHPALFKTAKAVAERLEIPYSVEVMPRHSGTDAYAIQVVAEGIPSLVISIPLRYMHTPVEVVSLKDIQRTARLTAELIAGLDASFMDQMKWDE